MPSPIVHTTVGYLIYRISRQRWIPNTGRKSGSLPLLLVILGFFSLLPDLDTIPGIIVGDLGRFHNQHTYSLIAGVVVALLASGLISWRFGVHFSLCFFFLFLAYEVHVILDYFTYGERGVKLFWPLTTERFTSGITTFYGVRWSEGWIARDHLVTLITESIIILVLVARFFEKWRSKQAVSIS